MIQRTMALFTLSGPLHRIFDIFTCLASEKSLKFSSRTASGNITGTSVCLPLAFSRETRSMGARMTPVPPQLTDAYLLLQTLPPPEIKARRSRHEQLFVLNHPQHVFVPGANRRRSVVGSSMNRGWHDPLPRRMSSTTLCSSDPMPSLTLTLYEEEV